MKTDHQNNYTNDVQNALDDREFKIEHHMTSLRSELTNFIPQIKEIIEKHPIGSVAAVLGVGVVMGYLASNPQRRGKSDSGSFLYSALSPAVQTVKTHLDQGGQLPGKDMSSILTPVLEAAEKHLSQTTSNSPHRNESVQPQKNLLNDLVKLLVPIGVEMGLKAWDNHSKTEEDAP